MLQVTSKWFAYLSVSIHAATKTRLERALADAAREENDTPADMPPGDEEDKNVGSDSDSECGDVMGGRQMPPSFMYSSLEASLWSLDMSATSSMETSVYETEVGHQGWRKALPIVCSC